MSKDESLSALSEAHDNLLIAADAAVTRGDPRDDGGWGVRDVLVHIAAWEAEATERIPLILAGAASREYDPDAFNDAAIAAFGDRLLHEARDDLERTHGRLLSLLDDLDEAAFAPGGAAHEWVTAMARHSQEHARALQGGAQRPAETE